MPKISRKRAIEKITLMAVSGDHLIEPRPKSGTETALYFSAHGIDPIWLAEELRDCRKHVPHFENLLGSAWSIVGNASVTSVTSDTHERLGKTVKGPGEFIDSTYTSLFETACKARDRAVEEDSYAEFLVALVQGLASIEAFINERAIVWNQKNPNAKLCDSRRDKVRFEDKVKLWIPAMTAGDEFDRGHSRWGLVKELKKLRDGMNIHPKTIGHGISYTGFARQINWFRDGISSTLLELHRLFGRVVPAVVIRAAYMADAAVVE